MEPILVLIRGNSGSGKTVLAQAVQQQLGYDRCLLLEQDLLRRNLLHASDHAGTPAVSLLETLLLYGQAHYPVTILEGILRKDVYGAMLRRVIKQFKQAALIYYLDVPFAITAERNQHKAQPFPAEKLTKWWRENDCLTKNDRLLSVAPTTELCQQVLLDIGGLTEDLG